MRTYLKDCLSAAAAGILLCGAASGADVPGKYFQLMQAGLAGVEERFAQGQAADLATLEAQRGWRHFPHALLVAAVLYTQPDPANSRYHDPKMLLLAKKIGDLVTSESEKGTFRKRLDHHRDLYMWLEAYRLLEKGLEEQQRERWRGELKKNIEALSAEVVARADFGAYNSPFIGTSPNHYSLWSSTLYLAGKVLGNRQWEELGAKVLHRFAAEEQAPDGYWGEHDVTGPTTGYDYLTFTGIALYWEHSKDPAALNALRRGTDFHKYFTYPDGTPVEAINDRNRYWSESAWGNFGFSHFTDGRLYAEFLASFFDPDHLGLEGLGRVAQNALYFHQGPLEPIPQDRENYAHRMHVNAGIRKTGPWVVCLSGLISTQAATNQFYLDRQGSLSIFHKKTGLIITGANSKRQPELATFWEKVREQVFHMPTVSRLRMHEEQDRLSLAYNTFFSDLYVPKAGENEASFRFVVTPKSRRDEAQLNLQLILNARETLETGAGRKLVLDAEKIELGSEELGGWIRHHGWTLKLDPAARLAWPVYPFNPYANGPEKSLRRAVGLLSVPVQAQRPREEPYGSGVQEISFTIQVN